MNEISMSNPKTKLVVWILIIVLFAGAFYWFLIKPQFTQIEVLKNQIMQKEQKLATLLLAQRREKDLLAENKLMEDRITQLQKILPPTPNEFLFGEEFQVAAKLCGVSIDSLTFPKRKTKGTPQNVVRFEITVSSKKLDNIRYFFAHIYTFPQIINVDKLILQNGELNSFRGGTQQGKVYSADISGIIYLSQRK